MAAVNERTRYAFWSYDSYPFVLGSKGEFDAEGNFHAYDYDSTFRRENIIDVMSVERGELVHALLEKLRADYKRQQDILLIEMMDRAHSALPALKDWRKSRGRKP